MKRIEQTELDLPVQHRCKLCNRPIKKYGIGKQCKQKLIGQLEAQFNDLRLIYEVLKGFYND